MRHWAPPLASDTENAGTGGLVLALLTKAFQQYWRLTRGLTLGAQGVVIDADNRVLLIKHTYRPGWHFPGGGVEANETVEQALGRELLEEAAISLTGPPQLFGLYANFRAFPRDHVALFLATSWQRGEPVAPNYEISAHEFFPADALPEDTHPSTAQRLREILGGEPRSPTW